MRRVKERWGDLKPGMTFFTRFGNTLAVVIHVRDSDLLIRGKSTCIVRFVDLEYGTVYQWQRPKAEGHDTWVQVLR